MQPEAAAAARSKDQRLQPGGPPATAARDCLVGAFVHGTKEHENKVYSQYGEDGIIEKIWSCIAPDDKYYVEFGVEDCTECNTRYLREKGWTGLLMDGTHENPDINLQREFFTAENIADHFRKYSVPMEFDHLTIDIDLNTFWVLHAVLLAGYRPRVIVAEMNRNFHPTDTFVVWYNSSDMWTSTSWFGAAPGAFDALFEQFGYHTVGIDQVQVNMYAVRSSDAGAARLFSMDEIAAGISGTPLCERLHECVDEEWLQVDAAVAPMLTQPREEWYGAMPRWSIRCADVQFAGGLRRLQLGRLAAEGLPEVFEAGVMSLVPCGTVAEATARAREITAAQAGRPRNGPGESATAAADAAAECSGAYPPVRQKEKRRCVRDAFANGTTPHETRQFSQYYEDGIIDAIFNCILPHDRFFVEFGVEDGSECTTRHLREAGWTGLMMDGGNFRPEINLQEEFFTAEGIAYQFAKHAVPQRFDHLTIDIDQNTFWVVHAILYAGYRPRVIVAEINRNFHPDDSFVTPYAQHKMWDGSVLFGASQGAFDALLEAFGYHVVGIDQDQINTYAVHACDVGEDRLFSKAKIASGLKRLGPCTGIHTCRAGFWQEVDDAVAGMLTLERQAWQWEMPNWWLACCDPPPPGHGVRLMTGEPVEGGRMGHVQCVPPDMHGADACAPVATVAAAVKRAAKG